ncbi:MAG: hypothetical protein ACOH2V_13010 [Candidatus Saccharimonadaceae bacterium]
MMNIVAEKFKDAWVQLDVSTLSECISGKVRYFALPSTYNLIGRDKVLTHLSSKFKFFRDFQAISTVEQCTVSRSEFVVTLKYVDLYPVTSYAVKNENIFMVICLEPKFVTMKIRVQTRLNHDKISNIKIFQIKLLNAERLHNVV